jgi:MoaA/NifB/PqqE/SkfB family radical SAM enzyme
VRPPHLPGSYLVVELTNRCSLKCVHCSVSEGSAHPHHAVTGTIDPGLVLELFADLERTGARFDALILFWLGEPLLHKDFGRIYRSALRSSARHGTFAQIEVHTNGTHLSPDRTQIALNDGATRQVWHFSLDAIDQATYAQVKGLDRFEQVQTHVEQFVRAKGASGARWPRPVFQFIVGSNNAEQAPAFRAHWESVCRSAGLPFRSVAQDVPPGEDAVIYFRNLDCPTAELQAQENRVFRETMSQMGLDLPREHQSPPQVPSQNTVVCSGFWKSPVVSWRGEVTTCTKDNLLQNQIGDLTQTSFSELWWGKAHALTRRRVAEGDYQGLRSCQSCFIPTSGNYSELAASEIDAQAAYDREVIRAG